MPFLSPTALLIWRDPAPRQVDATLGPAANLPAASMVESAGRGCPPAGAPLAPFLADLTRVRGPLLAPAPLLLPPTSRTPAPGMVLAALAGTRHTLRVGAVLGWAGPWEAEVPGTPHQRGAGLLFMSRSSRPSRVPCVCVWHYRPSQTPSRSDATVLPSLRWPGSVRTGRCCERLGPG